VSNRPRARAATATRSAPADRTRTLLIAGAAVALVVILGIVIALAGGTDDPDTTATATDDRPAFGPIVVEGAALPDFESTEDDPAIGQDVPLIEGTAPDGSPVTIDGTGEPTVVAFLAHWCPHCQRELPLLVDLMDGGELDGVRMVAVLTGTSADRPNFPPVAWLEREGWTGDILLDDESSAAAQAAGLTSYPYLLFLDGDGKVVARTAGEVGRDDIVALADEAR
jgi:cytochrome c biogenesis protein CcmG, thiol:disulfide interchange protein DsbE